MNTITLDKLLCIDSDLLEITKKYENQNYLLNDMDCSYYNINNVKSQLKTLFLKFKSAKYLNKFPIENNISLTSTYDIKLSASQKSTISQVDNAVTNYLDKQIWVSEVYDSLLILASKLTKSEAGYLIYTFLSYKSEETIAEKLGICKTSLQKIKKSCLVKMYVELENYIENDY